MKGLCPNQVHDGDAPPPTILVVDDSALIRSLVQEFLHDQDYVVLVASNGLKALGLAASYERPIDLLLTDFEMPGMTGVELAANLICSRPTLKVVFMSGGWEEALNEIGTRNFLQKPFGRDLLLGTVRKAPT